MEKVRYGIIGLGNQGTMYSVHLFAKDKIKDGYITALCDNNPAKIEYSKKTLQDESITYFSDYIEMLDSGLVDAVLVETPHYFHPEMVMECLKRGIHAICEKPAGVYTKHVREMNEAAAKSNALFGMMFNQRNRSMYRKMKEIIASGELGELQRVTWIITEWFRSQSYYDSGSWRATWAGEGGGVLFNQCVHQIDLLQWIIGELPASVNGYCEYGKWHNIEVEDEVTAFLRFKNGATGMFISTTGEAPGANRLEISGTKGKLLCENDTLKWFKLETDIIEYNKTNKNGFSQPKCEVVDVDENGDNSQHAGIINNFTAAILGKEELFVPGTDGIDSLELVNAIELSGWLGGKEVTIPVDEDLYLAELKKRCQGSGKEAGDDTTIMDTANPNIY